MNQIRILYQTSGYRLFFVPICVLMIGSFTATWPVSADVINASFETPDIPDPSFSAGPITGWTNVVGGASLFLADPGDGTFPGATGNLIGLPGTADGFQAVTLRIDGILFQDVGLLLPNTQYTLTVAFGHNLDVTTVTGWMQLVNGSDHTGSLLAEDPLLVGTPGIFVDRSLSFTTGNTVSGDLSIVLGGNGLTAYFDNVRLETQSIPEPASGVLGILGILTCLRWRNRHRPFASVW